MATNDNGENVSGRRGEGEGRRRQKREDEGSDGDGGSMVDGLMVEDLFTLRRIVYYVDG
jgi:hypothetical protein